MVTFVVEMCLGALSAAAEFLPRLDVAGIVDALCPSAARAPTGGQVIEALVAKPAHFADVNPLVS
ncbi:hypothetical protein ACWD7F_36750 [Streptomyces sp. NPDC005122]